MMGDSKTIRDDVQGLRAVAVLVVIVAHAGLTLLPGGFVGVDVFFVVSGFLISGLLYREIAERRTLSLATFWARRARRILPAASVVTIATVLLSLLWLPVIDARQTIVDAIWVSLFAGNVHFSNQDVYYFTQGFGASPLQHYWSLAVEEQFYVAWPLLLLGCLGLVSLARRLGGGRGPLRRERPLPRTAILVMLLVITGASFAWSVVQTGTTPASAYFSTFTRAWELGVGALVALITHRALRRMSRFVASALGLAGLASILAACLLYSAETAFPGYAAALPVLGTAALLVAGGGSVRPVTAYLLESRPMRAIGDWSYSLYLWHWPALILPERVLGRSLTPVEVGIALTVTVLLSALTFHFVETPFRTARTAKRERVSRSLVLYPVSLGLIAVTCVGGWAWTDYRGGEFGDNPAIAAGARGDRGAEALVEASVEAARQDAPVPSDLTPDLLNLRDSIADTGACDYREDVRALCPRGSVTGDRTVVVIGDSHARAWIPAFDKITVKAGWKAYYLVKSQCTAAHVTVAPVEEARAFTECDDFHDWVIDQVKFINPDLVVVASSPPVNGVYTDAGRVESLEDVSPPLADGYDELFTELQDAAQRVVLLRDVPKSADDPGSCLTEFFSLEDCLFTPVARSQALADVGVDSALRTGVEVVDPTKWLCFEGECPVVVGGTLTYRDQDHLTTEYAASLSDDLGEALKMLPG